MKLDGFERFDLALYMQYPQNHRGSYLLSPVLQSIIGATTFHFRVRKGIGWAHRAKPPL